MATAQKKKAPARTPSKTRAKAAPARVATQKRRVPSKKSARAAAAEKRVKKIEKMALEMMQGRQGPANKWLNFATGQFKGDTALEHARRSEKCAQKVEDAIWRVRNGVFFDSGGLARRRALNVPLRYAWAWRFDMATAQKKKVPARTPSKTRAKAGGRRAKAAPARAVTQKRRVPSKKSARAAAAEKRVKKIEKMALEMMQGRQGPANKWLNFATGQFKGDTALEHARRSEKCAKKVEDAIMRVRYGIFF